MNLQEFYQENARDVAAYTAEVERVVKQATGKSLAETGWLITMTEHWAYGDSPAFAARCAISYWTSTHRTPATRRKYAELQMARAHMTRKAGSAPWPTPRVIAVPSGFKPQATVFRYCAHADGMFAAYRIAWS